MARRKPLLAQIYAAHQKAKLERERLGEHARKAWAAEERRKMAAEQVKEAARQRREAERAEQARCGPRSRPGGWLSRKTGNSSADPTTADGREYGSISGRLPG